MMPVGLDCAIVGCGFFTWLLLQTCCRNHNEPVRLEEKHWPDTWVDVADLQGALQRATGQFIRSHPPLNTAGERPKTGSSHGPSSLYYTPDLLDLVYTSESWVFETFGYGGPGTPASRGVA